MKNSLQYFIELLVGLTQKELQVRYKYTIFGFLWLVINPLLQMIVIGFIFSFFMKQPIKNYNFHLFISLLVWNFFSLSLVKGTPSIVNERFLIKKSPFPRAVIPLSIILSNFIHLVLGIIVLVIPFSIYLGLFTPYSITILLVALIALLIFTMGVSLLTSALNVRFRDVRFFIEASLVLWFYITPIVYTFPLIPKQYIWIWRLNPLTSILQLFQHALLQAPAPGPAMLISNFLTMIIITLLGMKIFNKESKNFDDWV